MISQKNKNQATLPFVVRSFEGGFKFKSIFVGVMLLFLVVMLSTLFLWPAIIKMTQNGGVFHHGEGLIAFIVSFILIYCCIGMAGLMLRPTFVRIASDKITFPASLSTEKKAGPLQVIWQDFKAFIILRPLFPKYVAIPYHSINDLNIREDNSITFSFLSMLTSFLGFDLYNVKHFQVVDLYYTADGEERVCTISGGDYPNIELVFDLVASLKKEKSRKG